MNELKIVATILVKPEYKIEIENVLHNVVDQTRKEEGNVSYDLHTNIKNPLEYIILEVWKSEDAINIHNQSAHFQAFVKAIDGKVDRLDVVTIQHIY